ncbi:phage regulatory CII family protein [Oceanospirillum beijerinckii]|uniref:phage regulatory CII family protein n=1 Tax=Oceanospirillum beijerinckii TaxID=64976 RepID=UPI00068658F4|nr:phage regulatory CII family protein [Oceanospirillum beijerinckii]
MGGHTKHDGGTLTVTQACYHAVYEYPGGIAAVASYFAWNPRTLANKLNSNMATHVLTGEEAAAIFSLTKDERIAAAMLRPAGAIWHFMYEVQGRGDLDVLRRGAAAMDAANGAVQELVTSLEDGEIDQREARRIDAAVYEAQRQLHLIGRLAAHYQGEVAV